ncbi:MAG: alpha/beta fold hydrolase [Acidobacteria bacterium]|nr:alpha/beta fold hydrolase [Acidobacteriota bacterium]
MWNRWQNPLPASSRSHFTLADGSQLAADIDWQSGRDSAPTVILVHGLEGSSRRSRYMIWTASKFFAAGYNTVRLNLRNCDDTEMLTPTLYHAGQSEDIGEVVTTLIRRGLSRIALVGFSMGGNLVLKLAGEWGTAAPPEVMGVATISPLADLTVSWGLLNRPENWLYRWQFVRSLKRRMRRKAGFFPGQFDLSDLHRVRSVHDFDCFYQARYNGFADVYDYYRRASAAPLLGRIGLPTQIIHAADDPILPVEPFQRSEAVSNPWIARLLPTHGGHVGFFSRFGETGLDHFWAENRVLEFFQKLRRVAG